MSDEFVQEVQFREDDDLQTTIRKLRVLQEEMISLRRALAAAPSVDPGTFLLSLGSPMIATSANVGGIPVPATAGGFIAATVDGQEYRIPVYLP